MTDSDLYLLIIQLKCCAANYADKISTKLQLGACDETDNLFILDNCIEMLSQWNNTDTTLNCITTTQFDIVVTNAKNICNLCDC